MKARSVFSFLVCITSILSFPVLSQQRYIPEKIQDGVILHCFCWPLQDITEELPNIAAAGFGAIQVSPMQAPNIVGHPWYYFYGPCDYRFYENAMGTRADMIELCTKASEYGIKVIEDIVPNHLLVPDDDDVRQPDPWWFEEPDTRVVADQGVVTWDSRWSETHQNVFGWEIRTENPEVQQRMRDYLDDLYSMGVRGCRWDCAKHIALPSEGEDFWANVLVNPGMWHYGEILGTPNSHPELMAEYAQYMSITDDAFNGYTEYNSRYWQNVPRDRSVFWAESHDTFSNSQYDSQQMSDLEIDRSYALVAARQGATALYFSRPGLLPKDDIKIAVKGSTHFTSPWVREVNFFHNIMADLPEFFWHGENTAGDIDITAVYRQKGAVLVNYHAGKYYNPNGATVTVDIPCGNMASGVYHDQVTGNDFTVADGRLCGEIGPSGIAVVYDEETMISPSPTIMVSPLIKEFNTETATFTLSLSNATSGTYSIDGSSFNSFTDPTEITIGEGVEWGRTIHIDWKATNGIRTEVGTYEILKRDPADNRFIFVHDADGVLASKTLYTYIYSPSGATNAGWPGKPMIYNPETKVNGLRGWYVYSIPIELEMSGIALVSTSDNGPRYPAPGAAGISIEGKSLAFIYSEGRWMVGSASIEENPEPPTPQYSYRVFFDNTSSEWPQVYAYCWDRLNYGESAISGNWPGKHLENTIDFNGKNLHQFDFTISQPLEPGAMIIFNNGSGKQTSDFTFTNQAIYDINGATGELGPQSSLNETKVDTECFAEYYTLQGIRLAAQPMSPGIYICRNQNGINKFIAVR